MNGLGFGDAARLVRGTVPLSGPCSSGAQKGRFVVSGRRLKRGDVALRSPALATVLLEEFEGRRCNWCVQPFGAGSRGQKALRCGSCRTAWYCGQPCQLADWRAGHKVECGASAELVKALESRGLGGGVSALKDGILAARCLRAANRTSGSKPSGGHFTDLESMDGRLESQARREYEIIAEVVTGSPGWVPKSAGKEGLFDALCRFRNNNFAVVEDLWIPVAAGVFPDGAALNHSCRPNCCLTYDFSAGELPVMMVRIMEDVDPGEELTHAYVDLGLPSWERRRQLEEAYGFECACSRCVSGTRSEVDALLVAAASGDGAVLAENCHSSKISRHRCPLPPAAPCAQRDGDLVLADRLLRKASQEAEALEELALLEQACVILERWLHPRHIELVSTHAGAHTAAMAAGAWDRAKVHCQHLVDHYMAVYPEWHPLTGFQLYTLADIQRGTCPSAELRSLYRRAREILRHTHGELHSLVVDLTAIMEELADGGAQ